MSSYQISASTPIMTPIMTPRSSPIRRSYDALAEIYDQRWADYIDTSIDETLSRLTVAAGDRVLDVACGTGVLLERLLKRYPDLDATGLDLSPNMLAVARRRLPASTRLIQGNATTLPFPIGAFDLVISTNAFHYIRRPRKALSEMHRVLDQPGRLVLTDWCPEFWTSWAIDRILRITDQAHYKTHRADTLSDWMWQAGYRDIAIDRYKVDWKWGLMTLAAKSAR